MSFKDWLNKTLFPDEEPADGEEDEDEENADDEEEEEEEEDEDGDVEKKRPSRLSSLSIFKRRKAEDEDEEELNDIFGREDAADSSADSRRETRPSAPPAAPARKKARIFRVHASSLEDARRVCESLRGGNMVVVDLEGTPFSMAQSIMDFCCGVCCAFNCGIRNVNKNVFIIGPNDADFDAAFGDEFVTYRGGFRSYDM